VADKFVSASKESGGFGDKISSTVTNSVRGIAKLNDVIEGVSRTFLLAGQAVATMGLKISEMALRAASLIIDGPVNAINLLIKQANKLPSIDIGIIEKPEIAKDIRKEIELANKAVDKGQAAMQETLMQPLPGQAIREWADNVDNESQKAAEAVVKNRKDLQKKLAGQGGGQNGGNNGDNQGQDSDQSVVNREREKAKQRLAVINNFIRTRREREVADHEQRMERLRKAKEMELITEKEYNQKKAALAVKHQQKLSKIETGAMSKREKFERSAMGARVGIVADDLAKMTANVASENKAMFQINKAASIATATMDAFQAYNTTLKAYPGPLGQALAAAQLASGLAQVSKIKSQSFSGGGGGGSSSGGSGGGGSAQGATSAGGVGGQGGGEDVRRTEITIGVDDEAMFSGRQVRGLISQINDEVDGGMVLRRAIWS